MTIFNSKMFRRIPFVTISLLAWLTLCFVFESAIKALYPVSDVTGLFWGVSRSAVLSGHLFRFATASFFHMNFGHFLSNTFGLIIFLSLLEYVAGSYRALIVVFISALGGTIGSVVFQWVQYMVGASTILFGVYGALGILIVKYRRNLGRYFALIAVIWFVSLAGLVMGGYISLKVVDQGAHVGGFIAGALATICITRNRSLEELQSPAGLGTKIGLITLAVIFGISFFCEIYALMPLLFK